MSRELCNKQKRGRNYRLFDVENTSWFFQTAQLPQLLCVTLANVASWAWQTQDSLHSPCFTVLDALSTFLAFGFVLTAKVVEL
jgi:hypothetical protein